MVQCIWILFTRKKLTLFTFISKNNIELDPNETNRVSLCVKATYSSDQHFSHDQELDPSSDELLSEVYFIF